MARKKQHQQPWVVQFNGTSKPAVVAPFDGCRTEAVDMAALQGKRCLGVDGDWSLMFDQLTNECSLVSLANASPPAPAPTVISLPPLKETPPPYLRFGCALSNQSPPNCTVLLGLVREKSLLHCRPGDAEWSRLPVEFGQDWEWDEFDGPITSGHHGKVYATTMASLVAVDASSQKRPTVERTDIRRPPPCPVHAGYKCYPIPCPDGELFLVRSCHFGWHAELVDIKLFHWNQEYNAWETVESIGDRTFFVGRFSFVAASAAETGTLQPNCVHVLRGVCGEYGIYTVCLDDMTIRLSIVEGCDEVDDEVEETFWALPTSFGLEAPRATDDNDDDDLPSEVMQRRTTEHCCKEEQQEAVMTTSSNVSSQWSDLQTDLFHLIVKKISFIDLLHLKSVCKQWHSMASTIHDAKVSPLLMTTRPGRVEDRLEVFDPVSEKKYNIRVSITASGLKSQGSQLLHFTKNGWVIMSRGGDHVFFLVNPFKNYPDGGDVIALPPLEVVGLKGLSFSSLPGSPDFVVLAVGRTTPDFKAVTIQTWRIGDEDWTDEWFDADVPFRMASHSPVFLDDVFYFLDINGRLGVMDPNEEEMEWNVLEKPDQPIRGSGDEHTRGEWDHSYLVEWERELVAIFRECGDEGSIRIFKLDRSRMVWTELEGMEDAAVFWDRSNALIARPPPGEDLCNKVYLPNYTESDDSGRAQAFYCLKERQYYPFFNVKEPMNAIWFEPKLEDVLSDVCKPSVS